MTAIGYPTVNVGQFQMGTEDARNSTDAWVVGSSGKAAWQLLNRTPGKSKATACAGLFQAGVPGPPRPSKGGTPGADFWVCPRADCVRVRRTKWSRIELPTGDPGGRSSVDRQRVQAVLSSAERLAELSPTLTFPPGSRLHAKAASTSTAAPLAPSRGGRECGSQSTFIRL